MPASRVRRLFVTLFCVATLASCGDDDAPPVSDIGVDAGPTCEMTFTFETGSADGHAEPLGASAAEARAGRLEASELPADHLLNEQVVFRIETGRMLRTLVVERQPLLDATLAARSRLRLLLPRVPL